MGRVIDMSYVVEVEGLVKRYGKTTALAGVDLSVRPGMVLGLLGPTGAGKTTAVRILATLVRPDAGRARVGGYDVVRQADRVRELIGLTGQYAAVDEELTGYENLMLIGRLMELPRRDARARATELLERFALADAGRRSLKSYPGGMRRRLDLAASLAAAAAIVEAAAGAPPSVAPDDPGLLSVPVEDANALPVVVRRLQEDGIVVTELALRLASLDEVFLALTGHAAEEES